jgi:DNA polymerase III subunit epsilon
MRWRAGGRAPGARAYSLATLPSGRTPWRSAGYCAVDLELGGLDPRQGEIVSFAAIPIEGGRVRPGEAVSGHVRPKRPMDEASIRVHGLRAVDLIDAPDLEVALDPLLALLAGRIPVVHFAEIERRFLRSAFRRLRVRMRAPMVDTSVLGALWLTERDSTPRGRLSLPELAAALNLPSHRPHDAAGDALTTGQVFLALATHLDAIRVETVKSLVSADRRLSATRMYPTHRP